MVLTNNHAQHQQIYFFFYNKQHSWQFQSFLLTLNSLFGRFMGRIIFMHAEKMGRIKYPVGIKLGRILFKMGRILSDI